MCSIAVYIIIWHINCFNFIYLFIYVRLISIVLYLIHLSNKYNVCLNLFSFSKLAAYILCIVSLDATILNIY